MNVETLRYYERRRLLPEPRRSAGGHREYDEDAVRFVRAIQEAQAVGFTLSEIADYLRTAGRSPAASNELRLRAAATIDGCADRVELVPLDRWLGGTHITAQSPYRRPESR